MAPSASAAWPLWGDTAVEWQQIRQPRQVALDRALRKEGPGTRNSDMKQRIGPRSTRSLGHRSPADWPELHQRLGTPLTWLQLAGLVTYLDSEAGFGVDQPSRTRSAGTCWRERDLGCSARSGPSRIAGTYDAARGRMATEGSRAGGPSHEHGTSLRRRPPWHAVYQPSNRGRGDCNSHQRAHSWSWCSAVKSACADTQGQ